MRYNYDNFIVLIDNYQQISFHYKICGYQKLSDWKVYKNSDAGAPYMYGGDLEWISYDDEESIALKV